MEFEKLQEIIADVLNLDVKDIHMDSKIMDDLGRIPWMYSRLLWE